MRLREILTWNPLNTPEVKEIIAHATKFEIIQMQALGATAGLLFGATMALFFRWIIEPRAERSDWLEILGHLCVLLCILALEVIAVRFIVRWQLCRTVWAHEHGFKRATLKITRWL